MKRLFSFILTALIILSSLFCVNAAGSYFMSEGFYYGVQNGEAYVHGYEGEDWDIVIRETFLKYPVTSVEKYAFFENNTMEELSFYDAVWLRSIGEFAFSRSEKLQYADITSTIEEMGIGVFDGCSALTKVYFRKGALNRVPAQTFYGCETLETVIFENEISEIGDYAFAGCKSLEKLELSDSITKIGEHAFDNCEKLVIYCKKDSFALSYAKAHKIAYCITDTEKGDVNADGKVNINDVTAIQKYLVDDESFTFVRYALPGADVNNDEDITIRDATLIQRMLVGY